MPGTIDASLPFAPPTGDIETAATCDPDAAGGCEAPAPGPSQEDVDASYDRAQQSASQFSLDTFGPATATDKSLPGLDDISKLQPGDHMRFSGGASADVGADVGTQKALEIRHTEAGKFEVEVSTELAVGAKVGEGVGGGSVGAAGDAGVEATLGGSQTMVFDTADEAQRAAGYFLHREAASGLANLALPGTGVVADLAYQAQDVLGDKDGAFADAHLRSAALSSGATAKLAGLVGAGGKEAMVGLTGNADGSVEVAAKLEYGADGQPEAIVLQQKARLQTEAGAGVRGGEDSVKSGGAAACTTEVTVEQRFKLPPGTTAAQLAGGLAGALVKLGQPEVSAKIEMSGHVDGQQAEAELALPGDPRSFATPAVRAALASGDPRAAAQALSAVPGFSAQAWTVERHGRDGNLDVGFGELGGAAQFEATRTERKKQIFKIGADNE